MLKKILTILITITIISSMYNYVFAKYITVQHIDIAKVNVQNTPIKRKKYNLEVYYVDKESNLTLELHIKRLYEQDNYEIKILDFEGYTYLYSDKSLTGIIEKDTIVNCYYQKNKNI